MPTNRTKRTRKARPPVDPFDLAIVTGAPLPATFSKWRAAWRVEHPDQPGLIAAPGYPPLADVFKQVHGRAMTDVDADAIRARWPEVDEALVIARAREAGEPVEGAYQRELAERKRIAALPRPPCVGSIEYDALAAGSPTKPGPAASNWPEGTADDFTPVVRLESDDKDD